METHRGRGKYEPQHETLNHVVSVTSKGSDQPAHTHSLIRAFDSRLIFYESKLLNEHHLEFLSLKEGCTGSTESIHVKMAHCWKSHMAAHLIPKQKQMVTNLKMDIKY